MNLRCKLSCPQYTNRCLHHHKRPLATPRQNRQQWQGCSHCHPHHRSLRPQDKRHCSCRRNPSQMNSHPRRRHHHIDHLSRLHPCPPDRDWKYRDNYLHHMCWPDNQDYRIRPNRCLYMGHPYRTDRQHRYQFRRWQAAHQTMDQNHQCLQSSHHSRHCRCHHTHQDQKPLYHQHPGHRHCRRQCHRHRTDRQHRYQFRRWQAAHQTMDQNHQCLQSSHHSRHCRCHHTHQDQKPLCHQHPGHRHCRRQCQRYHLFHHRRYPMIRLDPWEKHRPRPRHRRCRRQCRRYHLFRRRHYPMIRLDP